jgi:hypothetical protein
VALDPSSPLHRFRVDPRAVRRVQVERLVELGVAMVEIPPARARPLLARFAEEFLDPDRAAEVTADLSRRRAVSRPLELERWLRPDCIRTSTAGCADWLFPTRPDSEECIRLERRADLPALAVDLSTMDDAWAGSWPGVFVRFETGRALVVTLDYQQIRCEVRPRGGTPYR